VVKFLLFILGGTVTKRVADLLLVPSPQGRELLRNFRIETPVVISGNPASEVERLLNSSPRLRFAADEVEVAGRSIAYVGRLSEEKGLFDLVDAVVLLQQSHPDLQIVLIGDGPLRSALEDSALRAGVSLTVTGMLDRTTVYDLLARCSVVVLPSRWYEMYGISVIEAIACSSRVVVSDRCGSLSDLLDLRHVASFLAGDVVDLAHKIEYLLTRPVDVDLPHVRQIVRSISKRYELAVRASVGRAAYATACSDPDCLRHTRRS